MKYDIQKLQWEKINNNISKSVLGDNDFCIFLEKSIGYEEMTCVSLVAIKYNEEPSKIIVKDMYYEEGQDFFNQLFGEKELKKFISDIENGGIGWAFEDEDSDNEFESDYWDSEDDELPVDPTKLEWTEVIKIDCPQIFRSARVGKNYTISLTIDKNSEYGSPKLSGFNDAASDGNFILSCEDILDSVIDGYLMIRFADKELSRFRKMFFNM